MTTKEKILGALAVLAIFAALVVGYFALQEHDARLTAEATVKVSQVAADSAAAKEKDLEAADTVRAAQTAATIDAMQKLVAQIKTPQQIAQWVPQQVPNLPQPITVNVPQAAPQNPTPNVEASIPQADLASIEAAVEGAKECVVDLTAAKADESSKSAQLQAASEQLSAVSNERDAYKKAAKGTFWSRATTAVKWVAIGGGIAIAATCGSGHCR